MEIKKLIKSGKVFGLLFDTESGIVFNPNSETIKLISSDARKEWGAVYFRSKRRGFTGFHRIASFDFVDATEDEAVLFYSFVNSLKKCDACGKYHEELNDGNICKVCKNAGITRCKKCGKIMTYWLVKYEVNGIKGHVCCDCIDFEEYKKCSKCGVYFNIESDEFNKETSKCSDCEDSKFNHSILQYHQKIDLIFKNSKENESKLYFGFELEIDGGGQKDTNAIKIGKIVGDDVSFTRDGSLDSGFEMVSQPMHYEYFMDRKDLYAKLFGKAIDLGYRSHTTTTCGLHFHMSRNYFTDCEITKLVYLFEKHWVNIQSFTRRTSGKLNKWASRYGDYHAQDIIDKNAHFNEVNAGSKIAGLRYNGRYKAINLMNKDTIEIRIFKGTLNINTFIASMQMLYHIVDMIKTKDFDDLRAMSWSQLMKNDYFELNEYLKIRGLLTDTKKQSKKVIDM